MAFIENVGGGGGKVVVRKQQVFNSSANFTAPANLVGNTVFITASGGGGGGTAANPFSDDYAFVTGGFGGCYCVKSPVAVTPSQVVAVTIGAGGGSNADGGATSFGALLTVAGGVKGKSYSGSSSPTVDGAGYMANSFGFRGIRPTIVMPIYAGFATNPIASLMFYPSETVNGFRAGNDFSGGGNDRGLYTGGACGYFGSGPDVGNSSNIGPANSGCGGSSGPSSGGSGQAGKLIVEWEELVDAA